MSQAIWSTEDATALREFFRRVPREHIAGVLRLACPAVVDADVVLKNNAEAVARVAAMRAGWDEYERSFFALADVQRRDTSNPEYRDMT